MKILLTIIFLSLLSSPSWGEYFDDLVQRNGVYYKKFTDVPFSGKIYGFNVYLKTTSGSIKNGKLEGEWVSYWDNGQLESRGYYKNGKMEGKWITHHNRGQLKSHGNYKNGKMVGKWNVYSGRGVPNKEKTGIFVNGVKISD